MAIEDGFFLAETIAAAGDDFAAAFRRFETIRLTCTARVQLESRSMWNSFLHVEGIERDVRNTTVARLDGAHLFDQHRQSRSIALQNNLRLHGTHGFHEPTAAALRDAPVTPSSAKISSLCCPRTGGGVSMRGPPCA